MTRVKSEFRAMARTVNPQTLIVPSAATVDFASELLRRFDADGARFVLLDRHTNTRIEIEETVYELTRQLLVALARNRAVSLIPYDHELTTHQAARLLNVSRPYLIRLLDAGKIGFRKVGTHRRVRREDLLAYKEEMIATSERAKEELARLSQEQDMGY